MGKTLIQVLIFYFPYKRASRHLIKAVNNLLYIVFVWSQYDGANIEQRTIGYGWHQNQEAKLKIVGGDLSGSNQQDLDPTIHYITSVIVP